MNRNRIVVLLSGVIVTCIAILLIINYSVNKSISWSLYPIGALVMIWASIAPLLVLKKKKAWGLFLGLTVTLIPYLFLIQFLVGGKSWVLPLALPIAVLSLAALAITIYLFHYPGFSKYYSVAIAVFLFGVLVNYATSEIVNRYVAEPPIVDSSRFATISISLLLSIAIIIAGFLNRKKNKE